MVYALIDDWLYMDANGKKDVYGRQEVKKDFKSSIKNITAAFLDFQVKKVSVGGHSNNYIEDLGNSSFSNDYITTQERLSTDAIQVIGARKEKIEEIYSYFKGVCINSLVPYGVAIRAFLKSKNLLDPNKYVIFLEDLKNQAVLTVFEGMYFSAPRRIAIRDTSYLITEVKRSWSNFLHERLERSKTLQESFVLISNNQEWVFEFENEGFLSKGNIIYVDVVFAVLEGLRNAKFAMHFALIEEILKQKSLELWRKRLRVLISCLLLVVLGFGSYVAVKIAMQKEWTHNLHLQQQKGLYRQQLKELNQQKFLNLLWEIEGVDYAKIYYDFVRSIPLDYIVENIQFYKDSNGHWSFQGAILPQNEYVSQVKFNGQGIFGSAEITHIIYNKNLGQQINLKISNSGRGI